MDAIESFVRQSAALHGLQLDDDALRRVTAVFRRNAELAELVTTFDLEESVEAAPIFRAGE